MRMIIFVSLLFFAAQAFPQNPGPLGLRKPVGTCGFLNTASTSVTTGAWVQIVSSTASAFSAVAVSNSGASPLKLAIGAASSEVDTGIAIHPGSSGTVILPLNSKAGVRLSLEALGATQSSGYVTICFFQ